MSDSENNSGNPKDKRKAEKDARLAHALRNNLRRRKSRQRDRGDAPPTAIKNTDRLTD